MTRPRPHGGLDELREAFPFGIVVSRSGLGMVGTGVATCVVRRSSDPSNSYLMSCRHVLSLSLIAESSTFSDMAVSTVGQALEPLGQPTSVRGSLDGAGPGFDAQLARLSSAAAGPRALRGLQFERDPAYIRGDADIRDESGFWVATGRPDSDGSRQMVWVDYIRPVPGFAMEYTFGDGTTRHITHRMVLLGRAHGELGPGDSGSPAILTQGGGRLIGMYIGGDGVDAYVIPAWQLLNPHNFGITTGESWSLA
jgi:hypothetical protein